MCLIIFSKLSSGFIYKANYHNKLERNFAVLFNKKRELEFSNEFSPVMQGSIGDLFLNVICNLIMKDVENGVYAFSYNLLAILNNM